MSEALHLDGLEPAPVLTDQQQAVYDALLRAGEGGLEASEAGAVAHSLMESLYRHPRDGRCEWCATRGLQILRRLRELGLARYRSKRKVWQVVAAKPSPDGSFGAFPEGF